MKLDRGETLVFEEDIEPAAREAIQPILDECKALRLQGAQLASQMGALEAKAEYLHKLKWSLFDKFHPKTTPSLHKDLKNSVRRYDWENQKVGIIIDDSARVKTEHFVLDADSSPGKLMELLEALRSLGGEPKEPKEKGPQAPESAPTPPGAPARAPMANPA